jgi:hypothetical protein
LEAGFQTTIGSWFPEIDGRADKLYLTLFGKDNHIFNYVLQHEFIHSLLRNSFPIQEISYRHKQNLEDISALSDKTNLHEQIQKIRINCEIIRVITDLYQPIVEAFVAFLTNRFEINVPAMIGLNTNITKTDISQRITQPPLKQKLGSTARQIYGALEKVYDACTNEWPTLEDIEVLRCAIIEILNDSFIYHVLEDPGCLRPKRERIVDAITLSEYSDKLLLRLQLVKPFIREKRERVLKYLEEWRHDQLFQASREGYILPNRLTRDCWIFLEASRQFEDIPKGLHLKRFHRGGVLLELKKILNSEEEVSEKSVKPIETCDSAFNVIMCRKAIERLKLRFPKWQDEKLYDVYHFNLLEVNRAFLIHHVFVMRQKPICMLKYLQGKYKNMHIEHRYSPRRITVGNCEIDKCLLGLDVIKFEVLRNNYSF